jgi:hypothetical protein
MYHLSIPQDYAKAIQWHGYRYLTTDFLCKKMTYNDDGSAELNLSKAEMWELGDMWDNEDCCFACGSDELNNWFHEFIFSVI